MTSFSLISRQGFSHASGDLPRVQRGVPHGQLLAQEQCNSFAISFEPRLRVHRVKFTLTGMPTWGPVDVRIVAQYRNEVTRTTWQRIDRPGTLPIPTLDTHSDIEVSLADAAAEASRGNPLLGLAITFDPGVCSSTGVTRLPPPIKIDELYVWAFNPPEPARNSVRVLAVEANQSVMSRPTKVPDGAASVIPDTRLMIDGDALRLLPLIARKDTLVRFYLGARYRSREFKPRFNVEIFNNDGSVLERAVEWQETAPSPIAGTVRSLTNVPHIPLSASEDTVFEELFQLRAGLIRQGTADVFIPPRFTRSALHARIKLYDADSSDDEVLGEVSIRFERPVTLGLNVIVVAREPPPEGHFDRMYMSTEDALQIHLRWHLPISDPIEFNRLPGVVDLRPYPDDCAAFLADRAALFMGAQPIVGTNWTSHLAVETVAEGHPGWTPCDFVPAIQGPGGFPLVVGKVFGLIGAQTVAVGLARNIGLVELCEARGPFRTPECEPSWPYIESGMGVADESLPLQKWGNIGIEGISDPTWHRYDDPDFFEPLITVNPLYGYLWNPCHVRQSIISRFPYCTEGGSIVVGFENFYVHDLMEWESSNWISDITYYRLYECLVYARCFDPPLYSLPDFELVAMAGDFAEGEANTSNLGWLIRSAIERSLFLAALQGQETKDAPDPVQTTFSKSDFPNYPAGNGERIKVLIVSGAVASDGRVHSMKVNAKSLPRKQLQISTAGKYSLELHSDKGLDHVIGFEPYVVAGSRGPSWGFNLVAPYNDQLAKLVIRHGKDVLLTKQDRPTKLDVVLEASGGKDNATLGKATQIIRWKVVGDISEAAEQVVEYSADNGKTWYPIAALPGHKRQFPIDFSNLPPSKHGRFAVSVSDGIAALRVESEPIVVE